MGPRALLTLVFSFVVISLSAFLSSGTEDGALKSKPSADVRICEADLKVPTQDLEVKLAGDLEDACDFATRSRRHSLYSRHTRATANLTGPLDQLTEIYSREFYPAPVDCTDSAGHVIALGVSASRSSGIGAMRSFTARLMGMRMAQGWRASTRPSSGRKRSLRT